MIFIFPECLEYSEKFCQLEIPDPQVFHAVGGIPVDTPGKFPHMVSLFNFDFYFQFIKKKLLLLLILICIFNNVCNFFFITFSRYYFIYIFLEICILLIINNIAYNI